MIISMEKLIKDYNKFCNSQNGCKNCPLKKEKCNSVLAIHQTYPTVESWLAERPVKIYPMDIDTEKLTKDYDRFCDSHECNEKCPLWNFHPKCKEIRRIHMTYPIVARWIAEHPVKTYLAEHPVKTYLMDMKEKFPDMEIDSIFYPTYCVKHFYGKKSEPCLSMCKKLNCEKCWNRKMKEK